MYPSHASLPIEAIDSIMARYDLEQHRKLPKVSYRAWYIDLTSTYDF